MFVTSFTTAAAFLANVFSALVPIRMFGIFMATIVLFNFLLVITWFPAILILWHRACDKSPPAESEPTEPASALPDIPLEDVSVSPQMSVRSSARATGAKSLSSSGAEVPLDGVGDIAMEEAGEEVGNPFPDPHKLGKMDKFFFYNYVPAIDGMNQLIVGIGFMLIIAFAVTTLFLKPHPGEPQFFPRGHQLADMALLEQTVFPLESGSFGSVSVVWGIDGIDRDKADSFNPGDLGDVEWDDDFNLADPLSQQHLVDSFYRITAAKDIHNHSLVLTSAVRLEPFHGNST